MWCIDNGHGALTAGKRSPVLPDGRQLFEFEFNRDIAARIFTELDRIGVAYFNVIPEVQVGNFLTERVDRANRLSSALPKLFLSIHGNAGPAPTLQEFTDDSVRGIETWYYHGSTQGRNLAAVFQRHLIEQTGMNNRHLRSKVTGQFYVLRATRMPAILTENGFYNNRFDLERMLTDEFRQQVAAAHVTAILEVEREGI
jgi:N-acetylmuramoyl-L-alanine amidase